VRIDIVRMVLVPRMRACIVLMRMVFVRMVEGFSKTHGIPPLRRCRAWHTVR
jgi:hypothetical protein